MADNPVAKLPLLAQLGISVVVAALIGGVFYSMKWKPMVEEQVAKETKLAEMRKDIQALEVTARKLPEFQREVAVLEQKLETLKRILPAQKETDDLVRKIQNLASDSSLRILQFNPGATSNREFYQEFPINLTVDGTYHNLAMFFDRLSRLSRLVNGVNIRITVHGQQTLSRTISASCVAMTYVFIESAAGAPAARK